MDHQQFRINSPGGAVKKSELQNEHINVNVFAGTSNTEVFFRIDDGKMMKLEQKVMKDVFFDKLVKENTKSYMEGVRAVPSSHIWQGAMPASLAAGIYRLNIIVKDGFGNTFSKSQLLEIN